MKITSILNPFKKIFDERDKNECNITPQYKLRPGSNYIDSIQVMSVKFKNKALEKAFFALFEVEQETPIPPVNVKYDQLATSFSSEMFLKIISLFKSESKIKISLAHNKPIRIEGENFIAYLAPRIENEER